MGKLRFAVFIIAAISLRGATGAAQQVTAQDVDKILERADKLLDEAKAGYEDARSKNSVATFVDAGFKLEEARIKFIVVQEIGSPDKQKTATDRLRAVNQLSKLIHDGKVSVGGTPIEPVPVKPPDNQDATKEPAKEPGPGPTPSKPPIDVSKRAPIPDVAKQKEAEKAIKDLYKDQYARKSPDDSRVLGQLLIEQASKPQDDPAFLWVLLREAQDVATQGCDVRALIKAIDAAARVFDVEAMALKVTALTAAGKVAKSPEDYSEVAQAIMRLLDELIRADQYDTAEKMASLGTQYARKSGDSPLIARAGTRGKEVSEAKSLYQSMKGMLETLAKNPDDPGANLETGKFLCFVKGSWDLGLRFMVKGSDPSLRALAEMELSFPSQSSERIALGDGWFDLSEKDKSPLRKSQLQAHARLIYESVLADSSGVVRARLEKRLGEMESKSPIDLLGLVEIKRDSVSGEFKMSGGSLITPIAGAVNRLQIPYIPPADAYDVLMTVQRLEGPNALFIGLALDGQQFFVGIDNATNNEFTGIWNVDGKPGDGPNETTKKGHFLPMSKTVNILCSVKKSGVTLSIDGRPVMTYSGASTRLSLPSGYGGPEKNSLWIGSWGSKFQVTKMTLTPIAGGAGRRLYP